jgi:regulator of sigma D
LLFSSYFSNKQLEAQQSISVIVDVLDTRNQIEDVEILLNLSDFQLPLSQNTQKNT